MKLYYEHDGISIYHGDCIDMIPSMIADVLVTDPPYGVSFDGKATKHTVKKSGGYIGEDSADVGPRAVVGALPIVKRAVVFPGTRNMFLYPPPEDVGCIYCPSGAGIGRWGFACFHPILFYGKRPSNKLYPTSRESFETSEHNGHPCPKPYGWMSWLLSLAALPGETVLDPFCGSGTTLLAAKNRGLAAIGIEREEAYCEIAARRLSQEVMALEKRNGEDRG